jgi:hypothetical protein
MRFGEQPALVRLDRCGDRFPTHICAMMTVLGTALLTTGAKHATPITREEFKVCCLTLVARYEEETGPGFPLNVVVRTIPTTARCSADATRRALSRGTLQGPLPSADPTKRGHRRDRS